MVLVKVLTPHSPCQHIADSNVQNISEYQFVRFKSFQLYATCEAQSIHQNKPHNSTVFPLPWFHTVQHSMPLISLHNPYSLGWSQVVATVLHFMILARHLGLNLPSQALDALLLTLHGRPRNSKAEKYGKESWMKHDFVLYGWCKSIRHELSICAHSI